MPSRERRAAALGVPVEQLPDGRGRTRTKKSHEHPNIGRPRKPLVEKKRGVPKNNKYMGVMYHVTADEYRYFLRRAQSSWWNKINGDAYKKNSRLYQRFMVGMKAEGSIYDQ